MGFVMALVCVTVEGRCGTSEELEGSTLHMCRGLAYRVSGLGRGRRETRDVYSLRGTVLGRDATPVTRALLSHRAQNAQDFVRLGVAMRLGEV